MDKGLGAVVLGSYFGVSRTVVDRWAADGVIVRNDAGLFDLKACTRAVYQHQQRQASGRMAAEGTAEARAVSLKAGAALKGTQQKLYEQKLRRESGEWCRVAHVCEQWKHNAAEFRGWALTLPSKARHRLGLSVEQEDGLEQLVCEGLGDISRKVNALDDDAPTQEPANEAA